MGRKIDIYNNGEYVCTTTQSKTCREAVERFCQNPSYYGIRKDGTFGNILILSGVFNVTAHFQK